MDQVFLCTYLVLKLFLLIVLIEKAFWGFLVFSLFSKVPFGKVVRCPICTIAVGVAQPQLGIQVNILKFLVLVCCLFCI